MFFVRNVKKKSLKASHLKNLIVGKSNFLENFRKLINRYKRIGYNSYVMQQTACLVINTNSVDSYASLFTCTTALTQSFHKWVGA